VSEADLDNLGFTPEERAAALAASDEATEIRERIREDYIATFTSPAGERVFHDLYVKGRQLESTYSQGKDPTHTAFLEGRRSMVVDIMKTLKFDDFMVIGRLRDLALANK